MLWAGACLCFQLLVEFTAGAPSSMARWRKATAVQCVREKEGKWAWEERGGQRLRQDS